MGLGFYHKLAFQNIRKNRQVYVPYILSSAGIIMMFYIIFALGQGVDHDKMFGGTTVATMMYLGTIVIGFFAVLFLFYTNSFIMKRRKKELGLYNILGMEKRHIARVIFRETLITSAASVILGLGFGLLFSKAMFLALQKVLRLDVPIRFIIEPAIIGLTAAFFLGIFFLIMLYNILQVRLSKPIELLHGSNTGEKEPKAHWFFAALGVLLLGGGYYMAVTIEDPVAALTFFFIAVLLVIAGTYLLFITGITALLKLLKKNRSFYYKSNHFTAVSGMLYRMKQNAAGLASICILFTCLLVTVGSTFSLYAGMKETLKYSCPREIMISSRGANDAAIEAAHGIAREECDKLGLKITDEIERVSREEFLTKQDGNIFMPSEHDSYTTNNTVLVFHILEDVNRFSHVNETLDEDEILICSKLRPIPEGDTVVINDMTFKFRQTDLPLDDPGYANSFYDAYSVVVKDMDVLRKIADGLAVDVAVYWDYAKDYHWYFNIGGSGDEIAAASEAIRTRFYNDKWDSGVSFETLRISDVTETTGNYYSIYGGLFFLGTFLGVLFLSGTALIIYYKQISEGYEDARRFTIMQQVGMSRSEVRRSIHSQIMTVFFLPLGTAVIHLCFASFMLKKILLVLGLWDLKLLLFTLLGSVAVFGLVYAAIYAVTARTYYRIVEASFVRAGERK